MLQPIPNRPLQRYALGRRLQHETPSKGTGSYHGHTVIPQKPAPLHRDIPYGIVGFEISTSEYRDIFWYRQEPGLVELRHAQY